MEQESMQDFALEIRRILYQLLIWAIVAAAGAWLAGYAQWIPGLLTGVIASALYFLQLCYRVRKSADMPISKAVTYMRVGWLLRLGFILLILILSVHTAVINFWAAVAGLFSLQMIMTLNAILSAWKGNKQYK